ncbi:MAG: thioredoxin family protein [Candidatus Hodarchaeota archaeon]
MPNHSILSIQELKTKGKTLESYLEKTKSSWGDIIPKPLVQPVIKNLSELLRQKECILLIFSAIWCKDCKLHLPEALSIKKVLSEKYQTDLEMIVFSGFKLDALNPDNRWKVPPSPPEAIHFDIFALPTFILLEKATGKVLGRIEEHPKQKDSLEEELVVFLQN